MSESEKEALQEAAYKQFGLKKSDVDRTLGDTEEQFNFFIEGLKHEVIVSSRVNEISIGLRLYEALSPRKGVTINPKSILKCNGQEILVDEDALMDFIRMINPAQKRHTLRFTKRDDTWWR